MLLFCVLFLCVEKFFKLLNVNGEVSIQLQHTNNNNSLKLGCSILEQVHIYSPSKAIRIFLSNIFVALYANNYVENIIHGF